jgi:alkylhydroperoxidase family enzyme
MSISRPTEPERLIEDVRATFGFVPRLLLEMSLSPAAARGYLAGEAALRRASLDEAQRAIARLAVSVFDESPYGRAWHAAQARAAGVPPADVRAVDQGNLPDAVRFRGVVAATWQLLEARGRLAPEQVRLLEAQGVEIPQIYELVVLTALATAVGWIDHIAPAEIDPELTPLAAQPAEE